MDKWLIKQLTIRTKHKKVQKRLLEKGIHLTLNEAIDITRTQEATISQMEQLKGQSNKETHGIKGKDNDNTPRK